MLPYFVGFADGSVGKESTCQCRSHRFSPWVERKWQLTPVFLPEKSHGQRSLYSTCVCVCVCPFLLNHLKEDIHHCNALPLNTLVYILYGKGNGNPFQYSGLENPMDSGAWWATVHGANKSRTWLKRLSMHTHLVRGTLLYQHTKIITKKLIISSSY